MDEEQQQFLNTYFDDIVAPLVKQRRFDDLCDRLFELLADVTSAEIRYQLRADLSGYLRLAGKEEEGFRQALELADEFKDWPRAWMHLGAWYFYTPHPGHPTPEEQQKALAHYETALAVAYEHDEWVRFVLYDICRVLTAMEDYPALESRMREIINDLANARRTDMPAVERDWTERIPEGAIDPVFRERYVALSKASYRRWRRLGEDRLTVPTLADLEAEP